MMVAGVGCRRGTSAAAIETVIAAALARAGLASGVLDVIATSATKCDEPGIAAAASALGLRLVLVARRDLETAGSRVATHSSRVVTLMGVGSVAEAAALAAAGPTGRLLLPRIAIGPATCALARADATSGAAP
jgi:cobalt-precorrin 5A hydrolase